MRRYYTRIDREFGYGGGDVKKNMGFLFVACLVLFVSCSSSGSDDSASGGTADGFRMKLRKHYTAAGVLEDEYYYNYDAVGRYTTNAMKDASGTTTGTSTYVYDASNRITRSNYYDETGTLEGYSIESYDTSGVWKKTEDYDASGVLWSYDVFFYDSTGRRSKTECREADGTLESYYVYAYDASSGLRMDRTEYDAGDNLLGKADYVFDANGRMIRMNNYLVGGTLSDYFVFTWEEGTSVDDLMRYYYSMIPAR